MLERLLFTLAGLAAGLLFGQALPPSPIPTPLGHAPMAATTTAPDIADTATTGAHAALYPIEKVMDGDTIAVMKDGTYTKVRLIGINSPEVYDSKQPAQCYGKEAAAEVHRILDGGSVSLETDPTQDLHDKYGRLLAYAFLPDGTSFDEYMVAHGFAREYTYRKSYKYQHEFKAAEAAAQAAHQGLWGACAK